ncbi:MAG: excinuclease ABC subunit UvrC [Oscillospiraceae bacterium]|nr:excinuclease ABC subunit UvrC [Oscillospiraceae bacterium]
MSNERLSYLREKAMRLPLLPGVYIMKNKDGEIIYIGKAKLLKNRVSQYFGSQNRHQAKVLKMVENVYDFDHILATSEFEALILECNLIKQHMPKYNILLKDDKGYCFIKITNESWRRLEFTYRKDDENATYIGPYISSYVVSQSLDAANKIFKLPTCNKSFPCNNKNLRPCLNYHMNLCSAPCCNKIKKEDYDKAIDEAIAFLKGGTKKYIETLEAQMEEFAENLDFEKAAAIRDKISAIKRMSDKQKVIFENDETRDVFSLARDGDEICINVTRYEDGRLISSDNHFTSMDESLENTRSEFIERYYTIHNEIPPVILTDGEVEDSELILRWLSERLGKKVQIQIPQKGKSFEVVSMSKSNAYEALAQRKFRQKADSATIELGELLSLSTVPEFIESYDISHTAGADAVGGMVVFRNGSPYKKSYRKFIIKEAVGGDDYGSMKEVLTRRFNEYLNQKGTGEGFGRLPDLILMDGGKGQVKIAEEVVASFGLSIPIFGMVKDSKHKTRAITGDGREISINSTRRVFTLVSSIQEEVHRFAIDYHHSKHSKTTKKTGLLDIPGIGPKKSETIWREMKTLDAIKRADIDTLSKLPGISLRDAVNIKKYYS